MRHPTMKLIQIKLLPNYHTTSPNNGAGPNSSFLFLVFRAERNITSTSTSHKVRDELLLTKFIDSLGCGRIDKVSNRQEVRFIVSKVGYILGNIIPFFQSYPLHGIKSMDYQDFCEIAKTMEDKYY